MILYLGEIICTEAYQEMEENSMSLLQLACWHQNENIVKYVLENASMQQQYMTETEIILSIWPVIGMNVCQQLLCIFS